MARTIKEEAYMARRAEILDAAQRLVFTRGYERMTIQDILAAVGISSGAFYHYFDSRPALLDALIERMQEQGEQPLLDITHDPQLTAIAKLQGYFSAIDQARVSHQRVVVDMLRAWYTDENAVVRQKVDAAMNARRAPLLNAIVAQGIREGVFSFPYPGRAGEVILSLLQGMSTAHAMQLLSLDRAAPGRTSEALVEDILTTYTAYITAIERVLGAPAGSFSQFDPEAVRAWVTALHSHAA